MKWELGAISHRLYVRIAASFEGMMTGDIFGSLLTCDGCNHGVGLHETTGCRERNCACALDKDTVVHGNVTIATKEYAAQWRLPE